MNADELMSKLDEAISLVKAMHAETVALRANVESLKSEVADLRERMTYREKTLTGWKEIGAYIGLSPNHARELASEPFDPLPVWKNGAVVVSLASALDAHKKRREATRKAVRFVPRETGENPS